MALSAPFMYVGDLWGRRQGKDKFPTSGGAGNRRAMPPAQGALPVLTSRRWVLPKLGKGNSSGGLAWRRGAQQGAPRPSRGRHDRVLKASPCGGRPPLGRARWGIRKAPQRRWRLASACQAGQKGLSSPLGIGLSLDLGGGSAGAQPGRPAGPLPLPWRSG